MKTKALLLILFFVPATIVLSQDLSIQKSSLKIQEPYSATEDKAETFELKLVLKNVTSGNVIQVESVQVLKGSTYPESKFQLLTTDIDTVKSNSSIDIEITTDSYSDTTKYILLSINYVDLNDTEQIKMQWKDTLFIENTYPFVSKMPQNYTTWNDGKRAEVFIGTNFDFFGENTLTDWYGGIAVFLPGITDFRFKKGKSNRYPRWGVNAGLYHGKSFSNFGSRFPDDVTNISRTIQRRYLDTINNIVVPTIEYRQDTLTVKTKMESNNWGVYAGLMYQFSRYESATENFVTNIFVGSHFEVIRRGVETTYTFDTTGTVVRTTTSSSFSNSRALPKSNRNIYFDAYFGVNMPIQFLWKEIIDLKITPCFGFGPASYNSNPKNDLPGFYLVNFDLLARLGGLKLNLGGEVRGYFPNQEPILSAYLGTSFSVSKLVDFITK